MRASEYRKLRRRHERRREESELRRDGVGQIPGQRPSVFRLFLMVLWAKITGN